MYTANVVLTFNTDFDISTSYDVLEIATIIELGPSIPHYVHHFFEGIANLNARTCHVIVDPNNNMSIICLHWFYLHERQSPLFHGKEK